MRGAPRARTVLEVAGEGGAVLRELHHALAELLDVREVRLGDLHAHGDLRGLLHLGAVGTVWPDSEVPA